MLDGIYLLTSPSLMNQPTTEKIKISFILPEDKFEEAYRLFDITLNKISDHNVVNAITINLFEYGATGNETHLNVIKLLVKKFAIIDSVFEGPFYNTYNN